MARFLPRTSLVLLLCLLAVQLTAAQGQLRKLGELELAIVGLTADPDPGHVVVPKNTPAGVRVVVNGSRGSVSLEDLRRFFGPDVSVAGELSGPGLAETKALSSAATGDPLLLPLPALATSGQYQLSNLRLVAGGRTVLDVGRSPLGVEAIEQILITSVTTRPLSLDELREKGIVLDRDDYLGFEFTMAVKLESRPVQLKFPVVFDRSGIALPEFTRLAPNVPEPALDIPSLPEIVPMLLAIEGLPGARPIAPTEDGGFAEVRIPSVLVIPGNVGYLKQFFSAQLFVANGAPGTSGLTVRDIRGTVRLPEGPDHEPGTPDDPLSLAETTSGPGLETLPVLAAGPDGAPGTSDDYATLKPGEQGMAEFLIRGDAEGFHDLAFDIQGVLDGLKTGPAKVTGTAKGGVLVRNPYFDVTFTVPSVVRRNEPFKLFATVTNKGQGIGNDVNVTIDASRLSGARLVGTGTRSIATLRAGDAQMVSFDLVSDRTGQVVASYLKFDTTDGSTGDIRFTLGVDERGVTLSPDTLVLPAPIDGLPGDVVETAMRVLGQAWSLANAPAGTLPAGVLRITKTTATTKALALAEAGLRVSLGQSATGAVRDLLTDFHGGAAGTLGASVDPGFDQLLRTTEAGDDFGTAVGAALAPAVAAAGGALPFQAEWAHLLASGSDQITVALGEGPLAMTLTDRLGRQLTDNTATIPGGVVVPLGPAATVARLAFVPSPAGWPYSLDLFAAAGGGSGDFALAIPAGDGTLIRATAAVALGASGRARVTLDPNSPPVLRIDADGDGEFEASPAMTTTSIMPDGARLLSAAVVGPETFASAAPFGFHVALAFDRAVDGDSGVEPARFSIPDNRFVVLKRVPSGRFVLGQLEFPEGPYVPTTVRANEVADLRGAGSGPIEVPLTSRLVDPGGVVSGRVFSVGGLPVTNSDVYYQQNLDLTCSGSGAGTDSYLAKVRTGADGRFTLRYVHQHRCNYPFVLLAQDPVDGAERRLTRSVRAPGEQIVADFALLGRAPVTGIVRTAGGQPVGGAVVSVVSSGDPVAVKQALTDGDGRYTVADVVVGTVSVRAYSVAGAVRRQGTAAGRIQRAGTPAAIDVNLETGSASVTGAVTQVIAGESATAPGALVLFYVQTPSGELRLVAGALTDSEGRFRFTDVPSGNFRIDVTLNTYPRHSGSRSGLTLDGDTLVDQNLAIAVPTSATVRGAVRRANGEAVAGALVSIGENATLSAADGHFELQDVAVKPAEPQTVLARTRDGRTGSASVLVAGTGGVNDVAITLSALGNVTFTVASSSGLPIAGQQVVLMASEFALGGRCAAQCGCAEQLGTTDASGRVTFSNVAVGRVTARATRVDPGFIEVVEGQASVVGEGITTESAIRFLGSGAITGLVLDPAGQPVFGADIEIRSRRYDGQSCSMVAGQLSHVSRTGTDGRFRASGVSVGAVSVSATHFIYDSKVGTLTSIGRAGDTQDLTLRLVDTVAGELSGRVVLPDGVTPAGAGIEVTASGPLPDVTVFTGGDGRFRFARIFPQGTYTLTVRDAVTGGVVTETVYLRAGQDAFHELRLKGRGTVRVRVIDSAGAPIERATVRLSEMSIPKRRFEAVLDEANPGVITFPEIYEGPISVEAFDANGRAGRATATLPAPDSTITVKVRFSAVGTVRGTFYAPDGTTPVPFATVSLRANEQPVAEITTNGTGDTVGQFEFSFVPAGVIRLEAFDPATGRTGSAIGRIMVEGDALELDIRAQGLGIVTGVVTAGTTPQAGAHVEVAVGSFRVGTNTDSEGRYRIEGVPEGAVSVNASVANGIQTGHATGTLTGDGTTLTLDVAVRDVGSIAGVVQTVAGAAPTATIVTAQISNFSFTTTTDETGAFRFERLPAGRVMLSADVISSIDRGQIEVDVVGSTEVSATLPLNGLGGVSGHARDASGAPTGGTVTIRGTGIPYSLSLTVGADGAFALGEVLAGPFTATLEVRNGAIHLFGTATGTIVAGAPPIELDIRLQETATVTAAVFRADGTTPAIGADVYVSPETGGQILVPVLGSGRFTAAGIPLGTFDVLIRDPFTTGAARLSGNATTNGGIVDLSPIVLDDGPVQVTGVSPADGAEDVSIGEPMVLTLSDRVVSATGITVRDGETTLSVSPTLAADGRSITIPAPGGAWPDSADVTVVVSTALTDIYGRHPSQQFTSHFHTLDMSPPTVVSTTPANGAVQVPVATTTLVVRFNEPLAAGNLPTVTLDGPNLQSATVTRTGVDTIAFGPLTLLTNSVYLVTVTNATDRGGNPMVAPYTGRFQTPDSTAPVLELISPTLLTKRRPAIDVRILDNLSFDPATVAADLGGRTLRVTVLDDTSVRLEPFVDVPDGPHTLHVTAADYGGHSASLEVEMTVAVPQLATLRGRVFAADGVTPRPGYTVFIDGPVSRADVTGEDALFEFEELPLGTYSLRIWDGVRNLALATATLSAAEEVVTQNLPLIARGTISGTITHPNGTPAGSTTTIVLQSGNTQVPEQQTTFGNSGTYVFHDVPIGTFSIVATTSSQPWRAEATGAITADGQLLTLDLQLVDNTVTLPRNVFDGNNMRFDQQQRGSLLDGQSDAFDTGLELRITPAGGSEVTFSGAATGVVENGGREVAITQNGIAGLNVTRKIFVPGDGYFARYLELLTNPGATAQTVNVRMQTNLGSNTATVVVATSDGDTNVGTADRWIVTDDASATAGDPTVGLVFEGDGAAIGVATATRSSDNVSYTWNPITIGPGQTVALMHFVVQFWGRPNTQSAAERLVQLPPEALDALEPAERLLVSNFVVPADGVSTLAALPLGGTVTGRVFGTDGVTPVAGAVVTFTSSLPMYRALTATASATGAFTFAHTTAIPTLAVVVPVAPFTLSAVATSITSPPVGGVFADGSTSATADVVFTNAGILRGRVLRHTGAALTGGGVVTISTGGGGTAAIQSDGTYVFPVRPAAILTIQATASLPSGIPLQGMAAATIVAGQVTVTDIVLTATGSVTGTVRGFSGEPLSRTVTLRQGSNARNASSNTSGIYLFTDVPVGSYTVSVNEDGTGALISQAITVVADQTTTQDLQFVGSGTLNGTVRFGTGAAAPGVNVYLFDGPTFRGSIVSSPAGLYSFTNVPATRPMTLRVFSPTDSAYTRDHTVTIAANGQTVTTDIYVPAFATVRVVAQTGSGTPVADAPVQIQLGSEYFSGTTNASGVADVANVKEGSFTVTVYDPTGTRPPGQATGTVLVSDHAGVVTVPVTMPVVGTVRGYVFAGDGTTALPGISVLLEGQPFVQTDAAGFFEVTGFAVGGVATVTAYSPVAGWPDVQQQVALTTEGQIVDVNLTLPITVVTGEVRFADGPLVTDGNVFAQSGGVTREGVIQADGTYRVLGVVPGEIQVTAQDGAAGLTGSAVVTLPNGAWSAVANVALQPSGVVTGVVRNALGQPVASASVSLISSSLAFSRFGFTDASGLYRIERVALGTISVVVTVAGISTEATGVLAADGDTLTLDINLPPAVPVSGTVFAATGEPLASAFVLFENNVTGRAAGPAVLTNASGGYAANVAAGDVRVVAVKSISSALVTGVTDVSIPVTGAVVNVTLGNAVWASSSPALTGTSGFRYQLDCFAPVTAGGTVDGRLSNPYSTAGVLLAAGMGPTCRTAMRLELGNRQRATGVTRAGAMSVMRKAFVPASGRYIRYFDIVENPTAQQVTLTVRVLSRMSTSATTVLHAATAGEPFLVMHRSVSPASFPITSAVYAGPGGLLMPTVSATTGDLETRADWTVTLEPGERIGLLHFQAQNEPADPAGADAFARELMSLTEPDALFGFTAEELALIRNFVVP